MCFVSGKKYVEIKHNSIDSRLNESKDSYLSFGQWYDSEFFKFKIFKKGTLHIEFKDKYLYEQFNMTACKVKNWLPDNYGHSTTQGKSQPHPKAKVYNTSVNKSSNSDSAFKSSDSDSKVSIVSRTKTDINIDTLLNTVKEIKNKSDSVQLNMLVENIS